MMDLRLQAYSPNGASLGPLPAPDSFSIATPLNDTPSLSLDYGVSGPRSSILGQPLELAVEISGDGGMTWAEPDDCRFLYLRDGRDPIKTADTWQAEALGYVWRLQKARILNGGADGRRVFDTVTPGALMGALWDEAQARGALAGMTLQGGGPTDAAGVAWGATMSREYTLGEDYLKVLLELASAGYLDFRMTGRTLKLYRVDTTLAQDRTVGAAQVQLTPISVTEAPFRRTWEGLADFIQVAGDEGVSVPISNVAGLKPWGRWEDYITQGGVSDPGTLTAIGQRYQNLTATGRTELTQALILGADGPRPFLDFKVGDYIWSRDLTTRERYRVRQITLQKEGTKVQGNVVLNDRFLEEDIRTRRTLDGILGGASTGGSTGGTTLPGADILAPAAVTGLTGGSTSYLSGAMTRATMNLNWTDTTTNADGTPLTDLSRYQVWGKTTGQVEWQAITETTESAAHMSNYAPGDSWDFRVRAVDTAGNEGGWSNPITVVAVGDNTPPVKPKKPTTSGRLGTGVVSWDGTNGVNGGPMDADFSYVEVHISGATGFTVVAHDPATLYGTHRGPFAMTVPDLPYSTNRYVKLVAFDTSGNMSAESAQEILNVPPLVNADLIGQVIDGANIVDGTLVASDKVVANTITGDLIQAMTIEGDHIKGNAIDGKTITGATIQTQAEALRGVKQDAAGIRAYSLEGDIFLNVDPAAGMAVVAGEVKSRTFTVASSDPAKPAGSSLGGTTEIATGGVVRLTGGTTPPKSAPSLDFSYTSTQFTDDGNWGARYGWSTVDGVDYYTSRVSSTGAIIVEKWSAGAKVSEPVTLGYAEKNVASVMCVGGGFLWVMWFPLSSTSNADPMVWKMSMDGQTTHATAEWFGWNGRRIPAMAWDSSAGNLVIAQSLASTDKVRFQRFTLADNASLVQVGSNVSTDVQYVANLGGLYVGSGDFGASRFVISTRTSQSWRAFNSAGVEQAAESWPSGMTAKVGLVFSGGLFRSMDQTGMSRNYTANWSTTDADQTKWVTNTLTQGATATYQTPESPVSSIVLPKRSRLVVTTSAIVNDGSASAPDRVRIYVGRGATDPGRTGRYLQSPVPGSGVITQVYSALGLPSSGTNAPATNDFPGGAGSRVEAFSGGWSVDDQSNGSVGVGTFRDSVDARVAAKVGARRWAILTADTTTGGAITVAHGLGATPTGFNVSKLGGGSRRVDAQTVDGTNLVIQVRDADGTATASGVSVTFSWEVWA